MAEPGIIMESRMSWSSILSGIIANGTGKKVGFDVIIGSTGITASVLGGLGQIETFLAIGVSGLMIVLLALRIYNEYRRAKRQDAKDREHDKDEG